MASAPLQIALLDYGAGNLRSVAKALERSGLTVDVTSDPAGVRRADAVVLPGVGAFGAVAGVLDRLELRAPLGERFAAGRPTLGVCLGLQLLAEASDESPGAAGLGVLPATVRRLPDGVRVPHLGWNRVRAGDGCRILTDGAAYFANSYALEAVQGGWSGAAFEHGGTWVAALERGAVLACQFHPELSGAWGQALLGRWLEVARC